MLAEMATRYIIGISPSLVMEAVLYCLRSYLACQVSIVLIDCVDTSYAALPTGHPYESTALVFATVPLIPSPGLFSSSPALAPGSSLVTSSL